jgi:hypothetical protein
MTLPVRILFVLSSDVMISDESFGFSEFHTVHDQESHMLFFVNA